MKLKDTAIWQNLVNNGDLPKLEVETYIADNTIYKLGLVLMAVIVVAVLVIRITK